MLFSIVIITLCFSCLQDDELNNKKEYKSEMAVELTPIENFKEVINEMNKPQYFPSEKYTQQHGDELSPERKNILFDSAVNLVYSVEKNDKELIVKNMADTNRILNKAFKIYIFETNKK